MTPPEGASPAMTLRSAVESGDFPAAQAALDLYLAWFRSGRRNLAEVSEARDFLESGMHAVISRRQNLAQELARLTAITGGYLPPRISRTWRLDA